MQGDRDAENEALAIPVRGGADQPSGEVADGGAEGEQKAETPIPLRIKIVAGDHQHRLLRRETGLQHRHRRRDDQEEQQKA